MLNVAERTMLMSEVAMDVERETLGVVFDAMVKHSSMLPPLECVKLFKLK